MKNLESKIIQHCEDPKNFKSWITSGNVTIEDLKAARNKFLETNNYEFANRIFEEIRALEIQKSVKNKTKKGTKKARNKN